MAEKVMQHANISERPVTGLIGASVQRKCAHCEEEAKKKMMRKETGNSNALAVSPAASTLHLSASAGTELPKATRHFMENAFSTDFAAVRVHTDRPAAEMSTRIQARAFTFGKDIYFNSGEYSPESIQGQRLLAHELTHVVQQNQNVVARQMIQRQINPRSIYCALHAAVCLGLSENPPAAALCWLNFSQRCAGAMASAEQPGGEQMA